MRINGPETMQLSRFQPQPCDTCPRHHHPFNGKGQFTGAFCGICCTVEDHQQTKRDPEWLEYAALSLGAWPWLGIFYCAVRRSGLVSRISFKVLYQLCCGIVEAYAHVFTTLPQPSQHHPGQFSC